jgi:prepilin-type N-terminal cleavage/methylation domain-containing protein
MHTRGSESGFTMIELLIASVITAVVMSVAFSTFRDALSLNEAVTNVADANQNLRAGTNLLVRDLLQTGRNIEIGGIPIPNGVGAEAINRPGPEGTTLHFKNNVDGATLTAITTGENLGATVAGQQTDLVTILMDDPFLEPLDVFVPDSPTTRPKFDEAGGSLDVSTTGWLDGDVSASIPPIQQGDLILVTLNGGGSAIQTVTGKEGHVIYFEPDDDFNFNQPGAPAGSITQVLPPDPPSCNDLTGAGGVKCEPILKVRRVYMYTYFVENDGSGVPRLMRAVNFHKPQVLAGVIEDLELSYDLVDGVTNPTRIGQLPTTIDSVNYSATQVRKVNLHVGVRSELKSAKTNDYLRGHLSTVVSLRNLAYVDRYQ